MGARGPKKKPAAAKRAAGTYRADRDAGAEVAPGLPPAPDWLGMIARAEWDRRAPELLAAGLISPLDQVAFSLWCQSYEQLVLSYQQVVAAGSYSVETEAGNLIQHPAVSVLHKARSDLVRIGREFGMTPSARAGLRPAGGADDPTDPLDEMARERSRRQQQSESSPQSAPEASPSPKPTKARKGTAGRSKAAGSKKTAARKKTATKKTATKKTAGKKKATKKKTATKPTSRPKRKSAE